MTTTRPPPPAIAVLPPQHGTTPARVDATCLLCHTIHRGTGEAAAAGDTVWRCATCGQHWDAYRYATVTAYRVWATAHDASTPSWWTAPVAAMPPDAATPAAPLLPQTVAS